jgi:YD repeat-containing protein
MKYTIALLLSVALFAGCKKDKDAGSLDVPQRLKSVHLRLDKGAQPGYCSLRHFFYENGQLSSVQVWDSTYHNGSWHESSFKETYRYNAAGKLLQLSDQLYTHLFIYDASNRLIRRIRTLNGVGTDTIHFAYTNGKVIGTWRNSGKETYYYFTKDLDRTECWDTAPYELLTSVNYRYHGSRLDKASLYLFKSFDPLLKADFTAGTSDYELDLYNLFESFQVAVTIIGSTTPLTNKNFMREYNDGDYPVTLLMNGKPVCFYTYY